MERSRAGGFGLLSPAREGAALFDQLQALRALKTGGTMGRAAAMLRISVSAVSKRIAALETEVGAPLLERHGRRVALTPYAEAMLAEASPLLDRLREVMRPDAGRTSAPLKIAATDSLLASWLPAALRSTVEDHPELALELHAHRGPMLIERVRSGDYTIGICPEAVGEGELVIRALGEEEMVIVPSALGPLAPSTTLPVWAIEERSLTWEGMAPKLARLSAHWGFSLEVRGRLESFSALVQVARAGFAHSLVPAVVAGVLGVPANRLVPLPGLSRQIVAVGRRSAFGREDVRLLLDGLRAGWPHG